MNDNKSHFHILIITNSNLENSSALPNQSTSNIWSALPGDVLNRDLKILSWNSDFSNSGSPRELNHKKKLVFLIDIRFCSPKIIIRLYKELTTLCLLSMTTLVDYFKFSTFKSFQGPRFPLHIPFTHPQYSKPKTFGSEEK